MGNTNLAMFYNSNEGDRVYDADDMTDWLKPFFLTGVFNGQLQVTANNDMTVTIAPGYVNIGGKTRHFVRNTTLDLETASASVILALSIQQNCLAYGTKDRQHPYHQ